MTCLSKHRNGTVISWSHGGVRPPPKALTPFCPVESFVETTSVPKPGLPAAHKHCNTAENNCINSFSHEIVWEEAHEIANPSNRARKRLHRQHAVSVKNSIAASMLEAADVISVAASGTHLSAAQKLSLKSMLKAHTKAFAVDSNDLGKIVDDVEIVHEIDTGDASPTSQAPYKLSHHEKVSLQEQLRQLLKQGVIRPLCLRTSTNAAAFCIALRPFACIPAFLAGCLSIAVHVMATFSGELAHLWNTDGTSFESCMITFATLALSRP